MLVGIILAILYLFLLSRPLLKKIKNKKIAKFILMAHKVTGLLFLVVAILHMAITLPLIKQRPLAMYILGFIMIFCALAEFISFLYRKKIKELWLRIHRITAVCILICLTLHVILGITSLNQYKKAIQEISIEEIDLSKVKDGTYLGECDAGYIYAKVEVVVSKTKIISVNILEHGTERGKPAEALAEVIVKQQKVSVDAISGATNSSKVIEQAVRNALEKGIE